MKDIPEDQVIRRMRTDNPWWGTSLGVGEEFQGKKPRAYFRRFSELAKDRTVRRAVLLMGPRRVGKTVLIHHTIQEQLNEDTPPESICYVSVDHPLYNGLGLHQLIEYFEVASGWDTTKDPFFLFFDEIQYLKDWEVHLKGLVDNYPNGRFVASGSAAAALKLKSSESGAGRFTDFLLPPLTFYEYIDLLELEDELLSIGDAEEDGSRIVQPRDIEALNRSFIHYLNFGGYPEVIFSDAIQRDPARFIKSDIIDKVLLRDLPSLYGIYDIQELNHLFTTLAFNSAGEVSLAELSKSSNVAKNTLKRYIEYLETAFLLKVVHRVDRGARRFQRATAFKVYLTNPSIRSALFAPIEDGDEAMGGMAETGIFSQWFHDDVPLSYARWNAKEVDIVGLQNNQRASWAVEVKWSDRHVRRPEELSSLIDFAQTNKLSFVTSTTKTIHHEMQHRGVVVKFVPASLYCLIVGYNVVAGRVGRQGEDAFRSWADSGMRIQET